MTLEEIAEFLNNKVKNAKNGEDPEFNEATKLFQFIPTPILGPMSYFVGYCAACVGFEIPGTKANPKKFGQVLVSNIGTLGLEVGLAPLCPPTFA